MPVTGLKVLIVDDSPMVADILKSVLKGLGHEVKAVVARGSEALDAYRKHKPDLVTMDIVMPDMDGIEATKSILAHDPAAIIVVVTSLDRISTVVKALAAGARGYVTQPIDREQLAEVIQMTRSYRAKIDRGTLTWEHDRPGGDAGRTGAPRPKAPASLKTLLVDDAPVTAGVLRKMLTDLGHTVVHVAKSGVEAIAAYRKLKPDLVTMDVVMPGIDGIEATKAIIKDSPDALIVMITSVGRESMLVRALAAGARGYVVQPVEATQLREAIEHAQNYRATMVNGNLTWVKEER